MLLKVSSEADDCARNIWHCEEVQVRCKHEKTFKIPYLQWSTTRLRSFSVWTLAIRKSHSPVTFFYIDRINTTATEPQQQTTISLPNPLVPQPHHQSRPMVPFPLSARNFVGREELLTVLTEGSKEGSRMALYGLGGVG